MSDVTIKPLGDRVLIKPHPKRTEINGLSVVEDYQPDTGGTVVALGDGIEQRKAAVLRAIEAIRDRIIDVAPPAANMCLMSALDHYIEDYQPEHVCKVGDDVTFGINAGTEIDIAGELYLLVREDDLETIAEPVGEPV